MIFRWARILRDDAGLLLEAWLALLLTDLALRFLGVPAVNRCIHRRARGRSESLDNAKLISLRQAVTRAARRQPWQMRCLPQSLALAWLLAGRGVTTDLQFGVRSIDGKLQAHAWLEYDGRSLDTQPDFPLRFQKLKPASDQAH